MPPRLRAALGFAQLPPRGAELQLLHRWLDTWTGLGLVVTGIQRAGFDVELRQYPQGWRVNLRLAGTDAVVASGWESTPWAAVQQAARAVVGRER